MNGARLPKVERFLISALFDRPEYRSLWSNSVLLFSIKTPCLPGTDKYIGVTGRKVMDWSHVPLHCSSDAAPPTKSLDTAFY